MQLPKIAVALFLIGLLVGYTVSFIWHPIIIKLQSDYKSLEQSYAMLDENYNKKLAELEEKGNQLDDLRQKLSTLNDIYEKAESERLSLVAQLENLTLELTVKEQEMSNLNQTAQQLLQELNMLHSSYFKLESDYNKLNLTYMSLLKDHRILLENYTSVTEELGLLRLNYSNLLAKFEDLSNDYRELKSSYFQLSQDYKVLEKERKTLASLYNKIKDAYYELQEKYNQLKANSLMPPYIAVIDRNVTWAFTLRNGTTEYWTYPLTTYIYWYLLSGPERYRRLINTYTNETYIVTDYVEYITPDFFSYVIPLLYNAIRDDMAFVFEVWYIATQLKTYSLDLTETPRWPAETITEGGGDIADLAILIASMLKAAPSNIDIKLVYMDKNNPSNPRTVNYILIYVRGDDFALFINPDKFLPGEYKSVDGWYIDV